MATASPETSTPDSNATPENPPSNVGTGMADSPFDFQKLKEQREEKEQSKDKPKQKRGRKPKGLSMEEKQRVFGPLFQFTNAILEKADIEPLSDEEVKTGILAWEPIAEKYLPALDKYAIWIPPSMWTIGVIMVRMNAADKQKQELVELQNRGKENKSNAGNS